MSGSFSSEKDRTLPEGVSSRGLSDPQIQLISGHESKMSLEIYQHLSLDAVEPADGVSASLLHPPLPALPLKLVFVIERIHDQPQL